MIVALGKVISLLIIILFTVASAAGYLILTGMITDGEERIAEGQRRLEEEQVTLDTGKARLEAGKRESSEGKKKYEESKDNRLLVFLDKIFKGGEGFRKAKERIAAGDEKIAKGEERVSVGEKQIDAGKSELLRGRELINLARGARTACAVGAAVFASLSIVLAYRWRRAPARTFRHTDT